MKNNQPIFKFRLELIYGAILVEIKRNSRRSKQTITVLRCFRHVTCKRAEIANPSAEMPTLSNLPERVQTLNVPLLV